MLQREANKARDQNADLKRKNHDMRGQLQELERDKLEVPMLRIQVLELSEKVVELAEEINEPLASQLAELPPKDSDQAWVLRERIEILNVMAKELETNKAEFYDPAVKSSQSAIKKLQAAKVDTTAYEGALKCGNTDAVVVIERLVATLADEAARAKKGVDKDLLKKLNELEKEVNEKVADVRLRVVPRGLIAFTKDFVKNPRDVNDLRSRETTLKAVIEVIREYIG